MSDATSILATQLSGEIATPSAWLVGTTYTTGQSVTRTGLSYYAISGLTGVDPATDAGVHWGLLSGTGPQPSTMAALLRGAYDRDWRDAGEQDHQANWPA